MTDWQGKGTGQCNNYVGEHLCHTPRTSGVSTYTLFSIHVFNGTAGFFLNLYISFGFWTHKRLPVDGISCLSLRSCTHSCKNILIRNLKRRRKERGGGIQEEEEDKKEKRKEKEKKKLRYSVHVLKHLQRLLAS